jgi:lipid-binding SYLF domain-containing protein
MFTTRLSLLALITILFTSINVSYSTLAYAASATEINIGVSETLKRFRTEIAGGDELLKQAKGVLVFPSIIKAGFGIGGEYGEGALQISGKTLSYYSTAPPRLAFS